MPPYSPVMWPPGVAPGAPAPAFDPSTAAAVAAAPARMPGSMISGTWVPATDGMHPYEAITQGAAGMYSANDDDTTLTSVAPQVDTLATVMQAMTLPASNNSTSATDA